MMQKNETTLLEPWLRYHEAMIEDGSIFVFDNGSADPRIATILNAAEARGVIVNRHHNKLEDYLDRGNIFATLIKQLDADNAHDFYFPIDCDEFLACTIDGHLSCTRADLDRSLTPLIGNDNVLTIPRKYVNSPYHPNRYSEIEWCKKCFFAHGTCLSLSDGFHEAASKAGSGETETNITYIEFHYRPYQDHRRLSFQKIELLVPNPTRRALASYAKTRRSNSHAAAVLLQTEYSYYHSFQHQPAIRNDFALLRRMAELKIDMTPFFSASKVNDFRFQSLIVSKHLYCLAFDFLDNLYVRFRHLASRLKRSLLA